jgi:hypothetical protein
MTLFQLITPLGKSETQVAEILSREDIFQTKLTILLTSAKIIYTRSLNSTTLVEISDNDFQRDLR